MPTVGNLPLDIRARDIEDLFYKYGRIRDIEVKNPPRFVSIPNQKPKAMFQSCPVDPRVARARCVHAHAHGAHARARACVFIQIYACMHACMR